MYPLTGRADLHMHTTASDGLHTAREMLDHVARHTTLNVIAITDHDCLDASLWAYSQRERYPFDIIPGLEITTNAGHVLGLWVTQPVAKGMSIYETTQAIHAQGGMAVMAHPYEPLIAPSAMLRYLFHPSVLKESGIDAVEVLNAGAVTPGGSWLARKVFESGDLPVTGSSDSHSTACIGTGVTLFPGQTADDLRCALMTGCTAAEGQRWQINVYLKHYMALRQKKRNASTEIKAPLHPPIPV